MSHTSTQADGSAVRDLLSVAGLLEEPQLARLYTHFYDEPDATVRDVIDELGLAQGTAYSYVDRLVEAGVVEVTRETQPRRYAARDVALTVTDAAGDREYTVTPALIDAVGRRDTDADIDTYVDRYGVAGLATALTYTVARERGRVTHRTVADDLSVSPLAAETILQALRPVVRKHHDVDDAGGSLPESVLDGGDDDDRE